MKKRPGMVHLKKCNNLFHTLVSAHFNFGQSVPAKEVNMEKMST